MITLTLPGGSRLDVNVEYVLNRGVRMSFEMLFNGKKRKFEGFADPYRNGELLPGYVITYENLCSVMREAAGEDIIISGNYSEGRITMLFSGEVDFVFNTFCELA